LRRGVRVWNVAQVICGLKEICEKYGCSHNTLSSWMKDGFPAFRLSGRVRVIDDDAVNWFRDQRTKGNDVL